VAQRSSGPGRQLDRASSLPPCCETHDEETRHPLVWWEDQTGDAKWGVSRRFPLGLSWNEGKLESRSGDLERQTKPATATAARASHQTGRAWPEFVSPVRSILCSFKTRPGRQADYCILALPAPPSLSLALDPRISERIGVAPLVPALAPCILEIWPRPDSTAQPNTSGLSKAGLVRLAFFPLSFAWVCELAAPCGLVS